jgi:hypothetical protein
MTGESDGHLTTMNPDRAKPQHQYRMGPDDLPWPKPDCGTHAIGRKNFT